MSRRSARQAAVEVLYAADVRNVGPDELLSDREDCDPYTASLVNGVDARRDEIDTLIGAHARDWTTERMSPVDLNVMRIATLELLEGDVPAAAAIDEAIAIAKRFSGEEAGRFVNGVLEALRQTLGTGGGSRGSSDPGPSGSGGTGGSTGGGGTTGDGGTTGSGSGSGSGSASAESDPAGGTLPTGAGWGSTGGAPPAGNGDAREIL